MVERCTDELVEIEVFELDTGILSVFKTHGIEIYVNEVFITSVEPKEKIQFKNAIGIENGFEPDIRKGKIWHTVNVYDKGSDPLESLEGIPQDVFDDYMKGVVKTTLKAEELLQKTKDRQRREQ